MNDYSRRMVLKMGSVIAGLISARYAVATEESYTSRWNALADIDSAMFTDGTSGITIRGDDRVSSKHIFEAFNLLWNSPKDSSPYVVANYFNGITQENEKGELYTQEWEREFNPLIVSFFVLTSLQPKGDITAWCAAFVNFCLDRSGLEGTGSALSSSFKSYGESTRSPKPGDIAVFESIVPGREWQGHVGFVVSDAKEAVQIIGGNQSSGIKTSTYLKNGKRLRLHSFRKTV